MSAHWKAVIAVLFVSAVLLKLGAALTGVDPQLRNVEIFREMVDSQAGEAFAQSGVFADGKVLQRPVAGTVPRGVLPLRYAATPEDAARAGEELANPFAPREGEGEDAAAAGAEAKRVLERGRVVYQIYCMPCHGATGAGDGIVTSRGVPPPPPLATDAIRKQKDGQIFHTITFGKGNMASHASQIDRDDRWKVVRFVRTLTTTETP